MTTPFSFSSPFTLFFVVTCSCLVSNAQEGGESFAPRQGKRELAPAMFVFGDSLIDNGNNNDLPSFAKANYYPYGIDFSGGPTGRFSNGYTIVDEIAESSGITTNTNPIPKPRRAALHGVITHG
ncbi:uncharacterized protein A4U43_C04F28000 [Asparagus officinalis]|uniref:GDSL esterase/lipase n=1 Tax=Asparagus officinalis TaxID=4686 RepID=A0A5P1F9G3_ASPOF|nr:uncharacterized protein A4U43_C04F28000 [Asparagus officinalis]